MFTRFLRLAPAGSSGLAVQLHRQAEPTVKQSVDDWGCCPIVSIDVGFSNGLLHMVSPFIAALHDSVKDVDGDLRVLWTGKPFFEASDAEAWQHPGLIPLATTTTPCFPSWTAGGYGSFPELYDRNVFPAVKTLEIHPCSGISARQLRKALAPRIMASSDSHPQIQVHFHLDAGCGDLPGCRAPIE